MSAKSNHSGTTQEQFSIGNGTKKIEFRTNEGVAEYRETGQGGDWQDFSTGGDKYLDGGRPDENYYDTNDVDGGTP